MRLTKTKPKVRGGEETRRKNKGGVAGLDDTLEGINRKGALLGKMGGVSGALVTGVMKGIEKKKKRGKDGQI